MLTVTQMVPRRSDFSDPLDTLRTRMHLSDFERCSSMDGAVYGGSGVAGGVERGVFDADVADGPCRLRWALTRRKKACMWQNFEFNVRIYVLPMLSYSENRPPVCVAAIIGE